MKNAELRIAIEKINLIKQVKLSGGMTLDMNTTLRNLSEADKLVEETRLKLCQDLCERRDPVGDQEIGEPIMIDNVFQFSPENSEKINKEYMELLNREAEVHIIRFDEEELKKTIKGIKEITTEQTDALLYFSKKF